MESAERSWRAVARAWVEDGEARRALTRRLAEAELGAFAWETVPVSAETMDRRYEDIVIDSPALARVVPDPGPFAEHFTRATDGVCTFGNLGGDAILVAPTPGPDGRAYPHLAAFVRTAPAAQLDALWIAVGRALAHRLAERPAPVWVSTAGLGVHWLHVRLDDRPKYYRHAPFRTRP